MAQFPHCDSLVLHAPGKCEYCDLHPDLQKLREAWGINFTGENDPNKTQCPAEKRRPVDTIHQWGGNRPKPKTSTVTRVVEDPVPPGPNPRGVVTVVETPGKPTVEYRGRPWINSDDEDLG